MLTLLLILAGGGSSLIGVIVGARWLEARHWRRSLVAYRLSLPSNLTVEVVAEWLATIRAMVHAPRLALLHSPPIGIEITGSADGIEHVALVPRGLKTAFVSGLQAALPGTRAEELSDYLATRRPWRVAAEATLTHHRRPLDVNRAEVASRALLSSLQPLGRSERVCVQWIMTGGGITRPVMRSVAEANGLEPEDVQAARVKAEHPLLLGVLRVGVDAPSRARAYSRFGRTWNTLRTLNAPGVGVVRRWWLPVRVVSRRMERLALPLGVWPLMLNTKELAGLVGLPLGGAHLPGVSLGSARQLPPPAALPSRGALLGMSNFPGLESRPLALSAEDRTHHSYVLGPAGSGKSVLLSRLILGDIRAGYGVVAFDMKGDLIGDIVARLDERELDRVLILDASQRDFPIGFNPLGQARTEEDRELVTDGVITVFKELWAAFWGPRSESVLRACITTLLATRAPDGSAYTMCEVLPLLVDPSFRARVVRQPSMPPQLRTYWQRFEALSPGEQAQTVGPILNKVEALTERIPLRLMLGQSRSSLNFADVFQRRRVVLVSLAQGSLGTETSSLLGALLVFDLWRAALGRVNTPAEQRRPVFGYIDEAQTLVKLPVPLAEMLAQARGFKFGLTLANQYVAQLPEAVRAAILGTVRTQLTFAPQLEDARLLAPRFAPLTADELRGLAAYEFALRPAIGGGNGPVVTGRALPPEPVTGDGGARALASRQRFGVARAEVEAALEARQGGGTARVELPPPGRIERGDEQ
jgi:hypothetical protein